MNNLMGNVANNVTGFLSGAFVAFSELGLATAIGLVFCAVSARNGYVNARTNHQRLQLEKEKHHANIKQGNEKY